MAEAALFVLVQIPFWVDVDPVDNDADIKSLCRRTLHTYFRVQCHF